MTSYSCWARYYDVIYAGKDYSADVERLRSLASQWAPDAGSLLDVACGTGKHVELLRKHFDVEGLDLSAELLEVARKRCPEIRFHESSMVDFDLGKRFDIVICMFSAIGHVLTRPELAAAIVSMSRHLAPGGVLVIEPWFSRETYWTDTITAHHVDQPELKLAWMYTSKTEDGMAVLDFSLLAGTPDGIDLIQDRQRFGLFDATDFEQVFKAAGLDTLQHPADGWARGIHVARAPASF